MPSPPSPRPAVPRAFLALLALVGCTGDAPPEAPPPLAADTRSVLLVVMDTVRADRTTLGGNARPTTPNLARLAARGTHFSRALSAADWTLPSHASLFSGLPAHRHGFHPAATGVAATGPHAVVMPDFEGEPPKLLAEHFLAAGHATSMFVANTYIQAGHEDSALFAGIEERVFIRNDRQLAERAAAHVQEQAAAGRPVFAFVNLMGAHMPLTAVPERCAWLSPDDLSVWEAPEAAPAPLALSTSRTRGLRRLDISQYGLGDYAPPDGVPTAGDGALDVLDKAYDCGVAEEDAAVGTVVDAFLAAYPDGVVAITADHGEMLGEHDFLFHGVSLWPGNVHVPLVMLGEGVPSGVVRAEPVSHIGLHDALLELGGLAPAGSSGLLGHARTGTPAAGPVVSGSWPVPFDDGKRSDHVHITRPWWLFVDGADAVMGIGCDGAACDRTAVFDFASDPTFSKDRAADADAGPLIERARAWMATAGSTGGSRVVELDPEQARLLEEIGYLDK